MGQGIKMKHSLIAIAKNKINQKEEEKIKINMDLANKRVVLKQKEEIKKAAEEKERNYKSEKEEKAKAEQLKKEEEAEALCKANGGENCDENPDVVEKNEEEDKIEREESPRE